MNKRSFTFGLGVGLVFCSVLFFFLYTWQKGKWQLELHENAIVNTGNELESQAKLEVTDSPIVNDLFGNDDYNNGNGNETDLQKESQSVETEPIEPTEIAPLDEPLTGEEEQSEIISTYTYKIDAIDEPIYSTSPTGKITVFVQQGLMGYEIAELLQEAGVVDDADAFQKFLINNAYTTKLAFGKFTFEENMTYAEISKIIIR